MTKTIAKTETQEIITNQWVKASWIQYLAWTSAPELGKTKDYYFDGYLKIETMGVGSLHGRINTLVILIIALFSNAVNLPIKGLTNASYRRQGKQGAQPDISYYIGERVHFAPESRGIPNLTETPPPDLAVEISDSSLDEDLGRKRLLYQELGIAEYWVIRVQDCQIYGFQIVEGRSKPITESLVIPGFSLSLLQEALIQGQTLDDGQIIAWFLQKL